MDNAAVVDAFNLAGEDRDALKRVYNIYPDRPSSSRIGALDFINDYKFLLPAENIAGLFKAAGKPAYRYLVDEPNPWQPSNGAHHAVDLLFLFGGAGVGCRRRMEAAEFLRSVPSQVLDQVFFALAAGRISLSN
ncbi:lipase catalyse the reaction [Colletotrichum navitas]|uniref:Lipase catalyse the reaction n=1 Tax=Colletotrichum navitas TaxID=681940 RepID=A0AAD8PUQ0_9PEZI|nr:lipase catalyse the reaction [Colletotrichum navitas]KAK1585062.1 lipase catalyse the reaction [Colletotrichum navitas]